MSHTDKRQSAGERRAAREAHLIASSKARDLSRELKINDFHGGVHPPVNSLVKLADFVTYDKAGLCNILNTLS